MQDMIIGLTGTMGSGKAEIAKYLKSKGFEHYVYSDILRDIANQKKIEPTRENLQKLGTYIKRKTKNWGILSKRISEKIKSDKVVVDGIRNIDEIKEFRKKGNFYLIGVDAPQRMRYSRMRKRKREGDPKTFWEFKRLDNIENRGKTKGQEINKCFEMADFMIQNTGSLKELGEKIDQTLVSLK